MMPRMFTIKETAKESSLAEHFVRGLCLQNKIAYVKAGKKFLINYDRFIDYLNAGESTRVTEL